MKREQGPIHKKFIISTMLALVLIGMVALVPKKKNQATAISLGKQLFFDPILSADSSVSCASCHKPQFYYADTVAFSKGVYGKLTRRNTPSVLNMANRGLMFWDGRAATLSDQVLFPIQDHDEMNLPVATAIARLKRSKTYRQLFRQVFSSEPDENGLSKAIAAFEASLETSHSKFDLYMRDQGLLTADEKAGQKIFVGKARCFDCHFTPDFTSDEFKNIGLYNGKELSDPGRFAITHDSADLGKFKIPGLRNVEKTAPYMHDGRFKTLRQVIDYYNDPKSFVQDAIGTDSTLSKPLRLTEKEKMQLEAFLLTLTDQSKLP